MIVENTPHRPGKRVHVVQGEHAISADPDVMMTTILGSCVAVCMTDPVRGVGGMNHFMLPEGGGAAGKARAGLRATVPENLVAGDRGLWGICPENSGIQRVF